VQSTAAATAFETPHVPTREAALALAAGFLGWTLDAFDFFLVPISVSAIAEEFRVDDATILFSVTLTLVFRPLGALIFGLLADRYGRRLPMMINLVFYSAIEVATGFAPNLPTFLILRAMFGIGMGGEWGVGTSLVMEKVPARWRGVLSGLLQEGYAMGFLLAAIAAHFVLEPIGWRPLFFLGGLPALLALFIRFFVKESEVWRMSKAESWSQLARAIGRHWKIFLYLTLLMAMMNFASHGTQDAYPAFMKKHHGMPPAHYTNVVMITMVGAVLGGLTFGLASDRIGRRRMMIIAFLGALAAIELWAFSTQMKWIIVGGFLMQFMVQGAWGIIPAHISELAPDQVRGFLPGFAYQLGNLIAASIGWLEADLGPRLGYPPVMAACAAVIFAAAIFVIGFGPERRGVIFGESVPPGKA
jgi:SHS family lactate transporter-like MFS transporter